MTRASSRGASPPRIPSRSLSRRQSQVLSKVSDSASRASSRGSLGHRNRRTSIYSRPSFNTSTDALAHRRRSLTPNNVAGTSRPADIRRWEGNSRTTTSWDCLRRDPELWFPSGDCLVHFYERGQSRRGASIRVLLADVESSNCRPLLERSSAFPVPDSPASSVESSSDDGGFFTNPSSVGKYELFIPAPNHLNREEALQYHLTTRNFFAWMFEKPLVGHKLGQSLVSLLERMNEFRPDAEENLDDLLAYIDAQGYTDFRDCPDHAQAVLYFAETYELRELWTDAFVHCAGMNDELVTSAEFTSISRTTKALITRAHLEMDVRLGRASKMLGDFLEDDFSQNHLSLTSEAQKHLERFRSFLHSFYVQRHGYWPPIAVKRKSTSLPKSMLRAMYFDFRSLYEYLVDHDFTASMAMNSPTGGSLSRFQSISAFDKRNRYTTLPLPLSRIPEVDSSPAQQKSKPLSKLFGNKQAKLNRRMASLCALAAATNREDVKVMESGLVREYSRFEREYTLREEDRISSSDARKLRWLLIYGILQTLISVTRAPQEVRDTEGVDYPLCCQTAGTPPWNVKKGSSNKTRSQTTGTPVNGIPIKQATGNFVSSLAISSRRPLISHTHSAPDLRTPRKIRTAPPIAPLVVRHPQPRKAFHEILIRGYGNGSGHQDAVLAVPDPSFAHEGSHSPHDPDTPGSGTSGTTAHSCPWSLHESNESMELEHTSMRGSPSIYEGDGESRYNCGTEGTAGQGLEVVTDEWRRLGMGLVRGLELQREKVEAGELEEAGRWGTASVDSWAPRRTNPEVDLYVGA